jgi:hypothetical protein
MGPSDILMLAMQEAQIINVLANERPGVGFAW